ncbi:MAG: calcium/sodium antiporter [Parvularcula sp.]|nr:calcium/sodium antiporter [Parvularcula sp.]
MSLFLLILGGLVALFFGGDLLVRGAASIASRFGVSSLVIGLTLVGFGTSSPELVTSLQAAAAGAPGVAIGNVVGSNIANILLILGLTAAISPVVVTPKAFRRDGAVLVVSALMCLGVVLAGRLEPIIGAVFVLALIGYVVFSIRQERVAGPAPEEEDGFSSDKPIWFNGLLVIGGLALTVLGARWLVAGAIDLAEAFGISDTIIGLTVVAVGTSLPELVTSFAAARRGQGDIAFGNIVGSNIYNVLFILGVTAVVTPIDIPASIGAFDIWVMLGATAALVLTAVTGWRVTRAEGAVLLSAYVAYTSYLVAQATGAM